MDNFVYLGISVCSADGSRSEQMHRIGLAAANMNNLACIWNQACFSLATKLRLYATLIVPYCFTPLRPGRSTRSTSIVCKPFTCAASGESLACAGSTRSRTSRYPAVPGFHPSATCYTIADTHCSAMSSAWIHCPRRTKRSCSAGTYP